MQGKNDAQSPKVGIRLTQVAPIGSMGTRKTRRKLRHRRVSGVLGATAVADGFHVSALRIAEGVAGARSVGM